MKADMSFGFARTSFQQFRPEWIPNCSLHIDLSNPQGNVSSTRPANNANVATLVDISGSGTNLSQSTTAAKYTTNATGVLGSVTFVGTSYYDTSGFIQGLNNPAMAMFYCAQSAVTSGLPRGPVTSRNYNGSCYGWFTYQATPSTLDPYMGSNGPTWNTVTGPTIATNTNVVQGFNAPGPAGSTATWYLNGTSFATLAYYPETSGIGTNTRIGAGSTDTTPNQYWDGMINEVVVYSVALTTSGLSQVQNYLRSKWRTA